VFLLSYRDLDAAVRLALPTPQSRPTRRRLGLAGMTTRRAAFRQRLGLNLPYFTTGHARPAAARWCAGTTIISSLGSRTGRGLQGRSFQWEAVTDHDPGPDAQSFTLPLTGFLLLAVCASLETAPGRTDRWGLLKLPQQGGTARRYLYLNGPNRLADPGN
jgi:hypothetical protein